MICKILWKEPTLCRSLAQVGDIFASFNIYENLKIMVIGILFTIGLCLDILLYLFGGKKEL